MFMEGSVYKATRCKRSVSTVPWRQSLCGKRWKWCASNQTEAERGNDELVAHKPIIEQRPTPDYRADAVVQRRSTRVRDTSYISVPNDWYWIRLATGGKLGRCIRAYLQLYTS